MVLLVNKISFAGA